MINQENDYPNLVTESGRETMELGERVALLAADVEMLKSGQKFYHGADVPFMDEPRRADWDDWQLRTEQDDHGNKAHAFNSLLGILSGVLQLHERGKIGALKPGHLSRVECELLAWRRGGFYEWRRVRVEATK